VNDPAIVAASGGPFLAGLAIGVFLGLLLGPLVRSWVAWREWVQASREADLTDRLLTRMEREAEDPDADPSPPLDGPLAPVPDRDSREGREGPIA
jgi:hypothetical protein